MNITQEDKEVTKLWLDMKEKERLLGSISSKLQLHAKLKKEISEIQQKINKIRMSKFYNK